MPTAGEFCEVLYRMFYRAFREDHAAVEISAGELHRRVGGYPGPDHRMPICCGVMRAALDLEAGDQIVEEPPSGQGASLRIRYMLPRREGTQREQE